jgi:hypothetical protein
MHFLLVNNFLSVFRLVVSFNVVVLEFSGEREVVKKKNEPKHLSRKGTTPLFLIKAILMCRRRQCVMMCRVIVMPISYIMVVCRFKGIIFL